MNVFINYKNIISNSFKYFNLNLFRIDPHWRVLSFKMDDCNLEKLGIKPGKIAPAFHQDTLEYSSTIPSNVAEVTLDLLTRDTGASYTISVSYGFVIW